MRFQNLLKLKINNDINMDIKKLKNFLNNFI